MSGRRLCSALSSHSSHVESSDVRLERHETSFPREQAALPLRGRLSVRAIYVDLRSSSFNAHGTKLKYRMRSGWAKLNTSIHPVARSSRLDAYHHCALNLHAIWQQGGSRPRLGKSVLDKAVSNLMRDLERYGHQRWRRFHGSGFSMPRSGEG
jgi:hypothetical protein